MLFTSLTDVKLFLEKVDTSHDDLLNLIILNVSARIEKYLNRLFEKVERTQYFNAGRNYYYLPAYPIDLTAALTVTDSDVVQTVNSDYYVWDDIGMIEFYNAPAFNTPRQIKIIWTGGYASYDLLPQELQYATILQSVFIFKRRKDIGLNSVSMPDGSISVNAPTDLLPEVKQVLQSLRKAGSVR